MNPARIAIAAGAVALLAGCAAPPTRTSSLGQRVFDPKLGVWSSPRLVAGGDAVPRGGGVYLTGRPYVIGGRTYVPNQTADGYSAVGTASWYGDAFHGRRTANGEVFDKGSISAAHPTLPLPSYVRVTNLKNGRSIIVRVNDRGPYHGGRVMDVSQRVAEALSFRAEGTARIKVDYVGRAPLAGEDSQTLMASLRTDGSPARMDGRSAAPVMLADVGDGSPPDPVRQPEDRPIAAPAIRSEVDSQPEDDAQPAATVVRRTNVPLPPSRPFRLGSLDAPDPQPERRVLPASTKGRTLGRRQLSLLLDRPRAE